MALTQSYRTYDDLYAAINRGEANPNLPYYIKKPGLLNKKEKAKEALATYDKYQAREKQNSILEEVKQGRIDAKEAYDKAVDSIPEYKRDKAALARFEGEINKAKSESKTSYDQLEATTKKSQADLTRSEAEARTGVEAGLERYRNLAKRTTLPGQQAIEDSISETTSSSIANLKKYSGGRSGLSALTDIYRNEQSQKTQLGIQGAQNQQSMQMNLAMEEEQAGLTMADIIQKNAVTSTNLGQGLYSAFTDYINRSVGMESSLYGAKVSEQEKEWKSQTTKPLMAANFAQSQYFENNPVPYEQGLAGQDWGEALSNIQTSQAQQTANNKAIIDMISNLSQTAMSLIPGSSEGEQYASTQTSASNYSYPGAQNYINSGAQLSPGANTGYQNYLNGTTPQISY